MIDLLENMCVKQEDGKGGLSESGSEMELLSFRSAVKDFASVALQ